MKDMQSNVPSVQNWLACPCLCGDGILKWWGGGVGGGVVVLGIINIFRIYVQVRGFIFRSVLVRRE